MTTKKQLQLSKLMKGKGINKTAFAGYVQTTAPTLERWLKNESHPDGHQIILILDYFNIGFNELYK